MVKASEETRHIAYELHPSVLDDLGLVASLRALCKEFSVGAAKVKLKFTDGAPPVSMPRDVASCLYRVAQESLHNITKHAKAKHVSVALTFKKGTVALSIADDGVGFDPGGSQGAGRTRIDRHGGAGAIGEWEAIHCDAARAWRSNCPGGSAGSAIIRQGFMKRARILLADDHPLTLEGMRAFLDPHHRKRRDGDGRAGPWSRRRFA